MVSSELLARWLKSDGKYCDRLQAYGLSTADIDRIRAHFTRQLTNKSVQWSRSIAFIRAITGLIYFPMGSATVN